MALSFRSSIFCLVSFEHQQDNTEDDEDTRITAMTAGSNNYLRTVPLQQQLLRNKNHINIGSDSSDTYSDIPPSPPKYTRNKYTFDSFIVGYRRGRSNDDDNAAVTSGLDLAQFGLDTRSDDNNRKTTAEDDLVHDDEEASSFAEFDLYADFDLSSKLVGTESWIELLALRRDAIHPTLSFYVDKVAFKRWLVLQEQQKETTTQTPALSLQIHSYFLKYKAELDRELTSVGVPPPPNQQRDNRRLSSSTSSSATTTTTTILPPSTTARYAQEIVRWLPTEADYVAKPTHLSCSGGVWLVHPDRHQNITYVGNGKKIMQPYTTTNQKKKNTNEEEEDVRTIIANDLAHNLQKVQEKCGRTVLESYALRHVQPGIVIEERFTQPTRQELLPPPTAPQASASATRPSQQKDTTPPEPTKTMGGTSPGGGSPFLLGGMEFKVFTIWGRAWLTVWRPGKDGVQALLYRNGTNLHFDPPPSKTKQKTKPEPHGAAPEGIESAAAAPVVTKLPEWIDWERIITIAETMGRHKDMFRTDIFVGVGAAAGGATRASSSLGSSSHPYRHNTTKTNSKHEDRRNNVDIRYVISETEIHPTPLRGFETVFEEAGRLWLAGYHYYAAAVQKKKKKTMTTTSSSNNDDGTDNHGSTTTTINSNTKFFHVNVIPNNEVPFDFVHL